MSSKRILTEESATYDPRLDVVRDAIDVSNTIMIRKPTSSLMDIRLKVTKFVTPWNVIYECRSKAMDNMLMNYRNVIYDNSNPTMQAKTVDALANTSPIVLNLLQLPNGICRAHLSYGTDVIDTAFSTEYLSSDKISDALSVGFTKPMLTSIRDGEFFLRLEYLT